MTYKISRNIIITPIEDYFDGEVPEAYQNGFYILGDLRGEKDFLINDTIKYFIDKFSVPKTQAQVLAEIEAELQSNVSTLEDTVASFMKFLAKRKILLPEDEEEPVTEKRCLFKNGDTVDSYFVKEILSNKNNVDIYLVSMQQSEQEYVLKLLNSNKIGEKDHYKKGLKQLEKEYEVLYNVRNISSISKVFEFNKEHEDFAYFTMEYINGRSVSKYINEQEVLTKVDCLKIIQGIIYAFSLLHHAYLIHGDIHSANVLVLPDKSIKIIDVGLSRNVQVEKEQVLKFGGVLHYMPPERINITSRNKFTKEPDLYSDVYQIGLLIYLVLYNSLPYEGFIWEELATNIKEQEPMFHSESYLNYPVPAELINIVKRCVSKNPLDRYVDAGAILEDYKEAGL
jgi:serine/threonine protein kinase